MERSLILAFAAPTLAALGVAAWSRGGPSGPVANSAGPREEWTVTLPDVPMATVLRTLPTKGGASGLADPWPVDLPRSDAKWRERWRDFAADVAGERGAPGEDAARLARLVVVALHQGRDLDAWSRLSDLTEIDAELAGALFPHLALGTDLDVDARAGLAEGCLLRPALTPPDGEDLVTREGLEIQGLAIGDARITARLEVRADGVDLRYRLDEGGPVSFSAVVPDPPGFEITVEYYDWERAETVGEPLPVVLSEVGTWYRLWARVRRTEAAWPTAVPGEVPRGVATFGLSIFVDASETEAPWLLGFADACETLFPFEVHRRPLAELDRGPVPCGVDLSPRPLRAVLVRDLAGHLARRGTAARESR